MELLNDFTTTVRKAFYEIDLNWPKYTGLVICGTHSPIGWESQIEKIQHARLNRIPTLGICFGLQLMAIEYARNVMRIKDATSEEFGAPGEKVVYKRDQLKVGLHDGESYWNNYEVRGDVRQEFEKYCDQYNMENINGFYRGVQYHPEYQSSKENPHPLLVNFLQVCKNS